MAIPLTDHGGAQHSSYHKFHEGTDLVHGSYEVFYIPIETTEHEDWDEPGWYWQAGFPDCIPDGDPMGPFDSKEEARGDADVL